MKPTSEATKKVAEDLNILHKRSLLNLFKNRLLQLHRIAGLIVHEMRTPVDLNLRHSIRAWRNGFKRFNYRMYNLDLSGEPVDYLSDFESTRQIRFNDRFSDMINNKLTFPLLMKHYGMPTPEIKGVISKGIFQSLRSARKLKPLEFLAILGETSQPLVIKPVWSNHGVGFIKVSGNEKGCMINGEVIRARLLADVIASLDKYVVTEFVEQGEYGAQLYAETTNTIRIVTLWDLEKSIPFIARVVQRIGTCRSYPVDSFKAGKGGISALIDPDSGEMGPGVMVSGKGQLSWHAHHPENQAPIQGLVVPFWPDIRRRILEYATTFPFAPYIGWDIVPTSSGFMILEGNSWHAGPLLQVHGPMLRDKRIIRFYRHYRIIR